MRSWCGGYQNDGSPRSPSRVLGIASGVGVPLTPWAQSIQEGLGNRQPPTSEQAPYVGCSVRGTLFRGFAGTSILRRLYINRSLARGEIRVYRCWKEGGKDKLVASGRSGPLIAEESETDALCCKCVADRGLGKYSGWLDGVGVEVL